MTALAADNERFNRLSATWRDSRKPMGPLPAVTFRKHLLTRFHVNGRDVQLII